MVTSSNFNTTTTTSSTSSEHSSVDPEASNGHSDPPEQDHQNATTYAEEEQEEDSSASFPGWTQSSLFLKSILDALSFEAAIPCSTAAAASPPPPAPEQLDQVPASSDQSKEGPAMVSSSSSSFSKNVSTTSTTYPDPDSKDASYNSTLQIRTTPKNAHPTSSSIEEGEEEYKDYEQPMKGNKQVPNNNNNNNNNNERSSYCCPIWTRLTENGLHRWIRYTVVAAGTTAARYPKTCVMFVTILSFLLAGIGLLTNFTIKFDHRDLFTPIGSLPAKHGHWVEKESGFEDSRSMMLIVHGEDEHKNNLLQVESMERLFQVVDTVRNVPGYKEACELSEYVDPYTKENTCWIWGPTQFWEHNTTLFQQNKPTETELIQILSQNNFPSGIPVFHELMFGEHEWTNQTLVLDTNNHTNEQRQDTTTTTTTTVLSGEFISYIPAFIVSIGFPATDATEEFQERALIELQNLRNSWIDEDLQQNPNRFQLDFFCQLAYSLEYQRALTGDMPLVPIIFMVMLIFTMLVFHMYGQHQQLQLDDDDEEGENDENVTSTKTKIFQSRASIGLASVVTIGCSLMSGFGILFIAGVPFTNITLMAPFIILGVGLDDTFISKFWILTLCYCNIVSVLSCNSLPCLVLLTFFVILS